MRKIKIEAAMKPIPFKRVSFNGTRRFNSEEYRAFKEELGWYALRAMKDQDLLKGALRLDVKVYKKRRDILKKTWGDVDNFTKAIMDSLNGICYEDDAQIVQIHAQKLIGEPRILIEVREMKCDANVAEANSKPAPMSCIAPNVERLSTGKSGAKVKRGVGAEKKSSDTK